MLRPFYTGTRQITENIVILTLESQINDACNASWMVTMTKMGRKMNNKFDNFIAFKLFIDENCRRYCFW